MDEATRANFLALVEHGDLNGHDLADGLAKLAGELDGCLKKNAGKRDGISPDERDGRPRTRTISRRGG